MPIRQDSLSSSSGEVLRKRVLLTRWKPRPGEDMFEDLRKLRRTKGLRKDLEMLPRALWKRVY